MGIHFLFKLFIVTSAELLLIFKLLYLVFADLLLLGLEGLLVGELALVGGARLVELLDALLELGDLVLIALLLTGQFALALFNLQKIFFLQVHHLLFPNLEFFVFLLDYFLLLTYLDITAGFRFL